jgi:hypothetical protein
MCGFFNFLFSAIYALSFMDTNNIPAFRAGPPGFFISDKFSYAEVFNELKVFGHTHVVFGPVSFIQTLHDLAWEISTVETKFRFAISKIFTGPNFAFDAGGWFIHVRSPAAVAFIIIS